jgi:DNA-binding protein Fis
MQGELMDALVNAAMARCKNNQVHAAKALGISRNTLRSRMSLTDTSARTSIEELELLGR